MTDNNPLLTAELLHKVQETAHAQNRQPAEVVADAVRKYLEDLSWMQFVERNKKRARATASAKRTSTA